MDDWRNWRNWFERRPDGLGWNPCTKEGWLLVLAFVVLVVGLSVVLQELLG